MRIEVKTRGQEGGSRSPARAFRKWVIIGAVVGGMLTAVVGVLQLALAVLGGALVGAAIGALFGLVAAAVAVVRPR